MRKRHLLRSMTLATGLIMAWGNTTVQAEVQTRLVDYRDGEVQLQGYLAWDDAFEAPRPGVFVVHEWWGLNDYARGRAEKLAELGYVAFAADMYGKEKVTEHGKQASEWMKQITANISEWQKRASLGLDVLKDSPLVDPERVAAIGYCFGGATVTQLTYAGADLAGVVSFHGSLPVATDDQLGNIKAPILVAHGHADTFVPAERIERFQAQLDHAGADWQMITYGGARHGFTNPEAADYGMEALAYDPVADARSWRAMQQFFAEIFEPRSGS